MNGDLVHCESMLPAELSDDQVQKASFPGASVEVKVPQCHMGSARVHARFVGKSKENQEGVILTCVTDCPFNISNIKER